MIKTCRWMNALYAMRLYVQFSLRNEFLTNRLRGIWRRCQKSYSGPVATQIHGRPVVINAAYTYPFASRIFPNFNNPLLELVHQAFLTKKSPVGLVDVGAAVGDTLLLLEANCAGEVKQYYAVEGDNEFFSYLQNNAAHLSNATLLHSFLSSSSGKEKELVRIHGGTASAQGSGLVDAVPLDELLPPSKFKDIDILKVDVDGFDGRVLSGAREILQHLHPAVIFEWHPILCEQTKNSWAEPLEFLSSLGYETFVFFTKLGNFSHIMSGYDKKGTALLAEVCLRNKAYDDWHFDIAALHRASLIDPVLLSEMMFAKKKKSKF